MLKICFLITGLTYGGAEFQVVELAVRLKARGWDVHLISLTKPEAHLERLSAVNIPVESLDMERGKPSLRALLKVRRLLRLWKPQILHSHLFHANLLARVGRPFYGVPVLISSFHNNHEVGRLRPKIYRFTDFLTHVSTNVSNSAVEDYIKAGAVPRSRVFYIPNGIDTHRFSRDSQARLRIRRELGLEKYFVWLSIGRFEAAKDHSTMLEAYARVTKRFPKSKLLLIGQGALQNEIRSLSTALNLSDNVMFLGTRDDVENYLNAADAFVLSSAWEGFSLVIAEALACERPVVATDCGGPSEILDNGKYGALVPPRSPDALAEAMEQTMEIPETQRRVVAKAGRAHIEANYAIEKVVDRWEALYQKIYRNVRQS